MARRLFVACSVAALVAIWVAGWFSPPTLWSLVVVGPLILVGFVDMQQTARPLRRNYPLVGRLRDVAESIRPQIRQYFVESDTDARPFSREVRQLVQRRAQGVQDTIAFGAQRDVEAVGHEWLEHALVPRAPLTAHPRLLIGGQGAAPGVAPGAATCTKPYMSALLNTAAMSYGTLSPQALRALSKAAALGGFAFNTGEGGLSPDHLSGGGDVVWQIGTGYFGCRNAKGELDLGLFADKAAHEQVRMIELKLSQGAKPGHGGILPAAKVTPEVARVLGVPVGQDVVTPPAHSAFSTPLGLLELVARLRELSGGKPVGVKLCVGSRRDLAALGKAMVQTGVTPDFISVDGSEGGTGAAPFELANAVGTPLREGLALAHQLLVGFDLRARVHLVASGRIATAFDMARAMALGADVCASARAMMMAMGCVQALRCDDNTCPLGIATQDPRLAAALDVDVAAERIARYQAATLDALLELVAAAGLNHPNELRPHHLMRRVDPTAVRSYAELYPPLEPGALRGRDLPPAWKAAVEAASAASF